MLTATLRRGARVRQQQQPLQPASFHMSLKSGRCVLINTLATPYISAEMSTSCYFRSNVPLSGCIFSLFMARHKSYTRCRGDTEQKSGISAQTAVLECELWESRVVAAGTVFSPYKYRNVHSAALAAHDVKPADVTSITLKFHCGNAYLNCAQLHSTAMTAYNDDNDRGK